MFKYKTQAELAALTPDEVEKYTTEKRAYESKMMSDAIDKATAELAKKGDIEGAVKAAVDAAVLKQAETMNGLETKIKEQGETIAQLKEDSGSGRGKGGAVKEIREKKEQLKALSKGPRDGEELEIKTLAQRSTIGDNAQAYDLPDIGQLATRKLVLYDLFPKITLGTNNNGTVRYYDWDAATAARAAASVAEGAVFQESTAKWQKYTLDLKKIGDTIPVTEELFEDEEMFAAELGVFLQTNVQVVMDTQLATGDGTSNTLTGIVTSSTAFVPVASGIASASIYDLIVKMSEAITKPYGSKYAPDFALMNITDINRMRLTKDHNDNYVLPPFVSRDGAQVGSITVIECNAITANTVVVGDRRFARIYEKEGMVIQKGWVNTQFTYDEMTLKVRKRLLFLIRTVDKTGFSYCSDIDAALTTLKS